ncbi:MAG: tyrosine-type recombinase/integrase [Pseudomonadota bacterium]
MLNNAKIQAAKPLEKIYRIYDTAGLYLEIPPRGKKRWRLKFRMDGKEKKLSLGLYPDVSLKDARLKRDSARKQIAEGIDPTRKAKTTSESFEFVALEWIEKRSPTWSERHKQTTLQRLQAYIFPHIGRRAINTLGPLDVLAALRIVEARGAVEAARKTLSICSQVFRYAVATARVDSDPCRDLQGALATRKPGHFSAIIEPNEVAVLMRAIDGYTGAYVVQLALRFIALTFVRPKELRSATWDEINFAQKTWTIPAHKMKMQREHVVPLSRQALEILYEAKRIAPRADSPFVFRSVRSRSDRGLSENTLLAGLRALGYAQGTMTAHGFRAMASSLLNGLGFKADIIERQLAHVEKNKIRAAYHRTEYMEERTSMMQAYADYLDGLMK